MKKILTLVLTIIFFGGVLAQPGQGPSRQRKEMPKIEEIVSDLSAIQKKRLENVMQNSRKEVDKLQTELDNVRKKIGAIMKQDGDHTDQLFPLLDREGELKAEITKEMYRTRQQIDQILTKEQIAVFRARCEADRKNHQPEGKGKANSSKNTR